MVIFCFLLREVFVVVLFVVFLLSIALGRGYIMFRSFLVRIARPQLSYIAVKPFHFTSVQLGITDAIYSGITNKVQAKKGMPGVFIGVIWCCR